MAQPQDCIPPETMARVQGFVQTLNGINARITQEQQINEAFRQSLTARIQTL